MRLIVCGVCQLHATIEMASGKRLKNFFPIRSHVEAVASYLEKQGHISYLESRELKMQAAVDKQIFKGHMDLHRHATELSPDLEVSFLALMVTISPLLSIYDPDIDVGLFEELERVAHQRSHKVATG